MEKKKLKVINALKKVVAEGSAHEIKVAKTILTYLELSYLFYQSSHWQTNGSEFYADHLLFQRLYESLREEIDSLGEKLVGVYGAEHVDLCRRVSNIGTLSEFLDMEYVQKSYISTALVIEKKLLDLLQEADGLQFSSGVKDLFAGFANTHEGNVYLLQQRQQAN